MMKRILGIITALVMLISAMPQVIVNAAEDIAISNLSELESFRDDVNSGDTYEGKTVTLTADIDMSDKYGDGKELWESIGTEEHPFNGSFTGAGHSINVCIDTGDVERGIGGLFGYTAENAVIANLAVSGSILVNGGFLMKPPGSTAVPSYVGAIAAINKGTIRNCFNTADVTYMGNYGNAGGIAGKTEGSIINCYNTGAVRFGGSRGSNISAATDNALIQNCFYLSEPGISDSNGAYGKTAEEFASGEITYLLNGKTSEGDIAWYQDIGTDDYPMLDSTHKIVLFDGERYYNEGTPEKHIHKICGDENCTDEHEDIEWTAWDSTDTLPTEAGNYYLTKDIDLSEMWCPETAVNLCLNGHIVSCDWYGGSPDSAFFFYELTDTITLTDCADTEHKFSLGNNGQWVLDENGTKTLKGGTVINPNGYYAIKAYDASVNMYNINITGSYGGIWTDTLNMYNCTLAGNYGTEALRIENTANIRDCSIFENTGGGVYIGKENLNIGGKMLISDNSTYKGVSSNVFFAYSSSITIGVPLTDGSYIGIYSDFDASEESPLNITGENDTDYSKYFHSDNKDYKIINGENNSIQLIYDKDGRAYPYTVTEITIFNLDTGYPIHYIPKNKEFVIGINVHKNVELDEYAFIICALFDTDGALMGIYPVKMQSSSEIIPYVEQIPAQDRNVGSIKAFVWDSFNSIIPLAEAKNLSLVE